MAGGQNKRFKQFTRGLYAAALYVPEGGYQWRDDLVPAPEEQSRADRGPWLVERTPASEPRPAMMSAPLKDESNRGDPGLHRTFARLDSSPDSIRSFAEKHGRVATAHLLQDADGTVYWGSSLREWLRERDTLEALVRIWDHVRNRDTPALEPFITWETKPNRVLLGCAPGLLPGGLVGDIFQTSEIVDQWVVGDVIRPFRFFISQAINERMKGSVSPALLPFTGNDIYMDIYMVPDSLLASLYVLFALEVGGHQRAPINCKYCKREFIPLTKRKEFCSDSCRVRYNEKGGPKNGR